MRWEEGGSNQQQCSSRLNWLEDWRYTMLHYLFLSLLWARHWMWKGNTDIAQTIYLGNRRKGNDCDRWLNHTTGKIKNDIFYGEVSLPGVDAIFATEGVFHRETSVVELQGWEASLIQAHHLSMGQRQRRAVGVVAWKGIRGQHCVGCGMKGRIVILI